ncbi:ubiquitin-like modifier-activating enzyme ATG7 [Micractinium conductrix]|uniref:Ubiquitin-like modifier-activating enzyme ATG7 n=1 Tax=Micractinium conductrix TaxID=554055 RepID=A0A2P6VLG6_9CHLO|nr:ubiquitin-like modifier-activating enzyme ATG7 [Micractinium conductrix]|eukprot:PSC74928.1 ubiquitin-like modifier-activating enzyme ATG7 [Micractinium conductrix]
MDPFGGLDTLRFWPFESKVEAATFWSALGELKLHSLKLGEGPLPLRASWSPSNHASQPGLLSVGADSLPQPGGGGGAAAPAPAGGAPDLAPPRAAGGSPSFDAPAQLWVLNTVERLLKFDRKAAAQQAGDRVWAAIGSGAAEADPRLLAPALLLAYCDLKHYKYRYWWAFPALQPPQPIALAAPPASLAAALGGDAAVAAVAAACAAHVAATGLPAWLVSMDSGGGDGSSAALPGVATAPLTDWARVRQEAEAAAGVPGERQVWLAVADSSHLAENPGWLLRNLLLLAAARWGVRTLGVLCLRGRRGRFDASASLALHVTLPQVPPGYAPPALGGWEPNERGRPGPRTADVAPALDPRQLAEAAVELNLRLMRWRAVPALDVGAIAGTRCLLLGAGTLGCSVARCLLGWGVRRITFVDNSRVAYSNPVRQSLFNFEDCLEGGRPKAAAAAEALQRIFPGASAAGVQLSVPMPGHPLAAADEEQVARDIAQLEALVDDHDVVFLLMDTRESRWLPTLLCAARGRLALNAALGFDGYVVMRHGAPLPPEPREVSGAAAGGEAAGAEGHAAPAEQQAGRAAAGQAAAERAAAAEPPGDQRAPGVQPPAPASEPPSQPRGRLGCYFCNDVVAPLNSTVDRTLDQQCTVARPGLSAIAGSLAVELMAAVLQHPAGAAAPPLGNGGFGGAGAGATGDGDPSNEGQRELPLGGAPHMIRGQLSGFTQLCLTGQAFSQCTACSPAVVRAYRQRGRAFLLEGLRDPTRLEDLTGLTELHRSSEALMEAWGSSDDEEDEGETGGEAGRGKGGGGDGGEGGGGGGGEEEWEEL